MNFKNWINDNGGIGITIALFFVAVIPASILTSIIYIIAENKGAELNASWITLLFILSFIASIGFFYGFQRNKTYKQYREKLGLSYKEVDQFVHLKHELKMCFPLFHKLCQLNSSAKESQKKILTRRYTEIMWELKQVYRNDFTEAEINKAYQFIRQKGQETKRKIISLLFQLAVAEDGIKNDEWNLLQTIMLQTKLERGWINYFSQRYRSLRTEFDSYSYQQNNNSSNRTIVRNQSYYNVLGLDSNASPEEVKKAYHQMALEHHPDLPKNADRKVECEAMMAKINEAYAKISAS